MSDTSAGLPAEPTSSMPMPPAPSPVPDPGPTTAPAAEPAGPPAEQAAVPAPGSSADPDPERSPEPAGAGAAEAESDGPAAGSGGGQSAARRRRKRPAGGATRPADVDAPGEGPGVAPEEAAAVAASPVVATTTPDSEGSDVDSSAPATNGASAPGPRIGEARPGPPRPRIGDTRPARPPAPVPAPAPASAAPTAAQGSATAASPVAGASAAATSAAAVPPAAAAGPSLSAPAAGATAGPVTDAGAEAGDEPETPRGSGRSRRRSGRERRGRPVGRYFMCVHVRPHATQIAVLEGRTLVEHYVSRVSDDTSQIDGNIYRGRVQNVLPGMEAAFVDIATPKNAVLYRGDVRYDRDDIESPRGDSPRIEQMLRAGQTILCQVTKNPIGAKGARLTQEVSLPGRFVVMVPNSSAFGISKRLDDAERRRLRRIVDDVRPAGHGLIVRTAAEGASQEELRLDVQRLVSQWAAIEAAAAGSTAPGLLYREPDLAVRIVREEFNREYRGVAIDDPALFAQVRDYVAEVNPELVERIELYDPVAEGLPVFERYHVHEQLHKALDRKVWLPSGGSIIIERTEALTVIDVNTGKNVGKSNLEETVYRNNLEAAEEIARQLRLRDIGGIIVIDFIDMEVRENRDKVAAALRAALARDKTRTQVFDISELGLVEMTRKRISEGLVEALSSICSICGGRGIILDETLV